MKCFYHNDLDGHCSAAIVKIFLDTTDNEAETNRYYEMDYSKPFPFDDIIKDEKIIIVDFSLSTQDGWNKLLKITKNIVWIDHHITALEKYKPLKLNGLQDTRAAACELTWQYYFPSIKMPVVVKLLGDYDTWTLKYGDDSKVLQLGMHLHDTHPESDNWKQWIELNQAINTLINEGKTAMKFRTQQYAGIIKDNQQTIEFEGHECIICNTHERRSQLFDEINPKENVIMMPYNWNGKKWTVSLYNAGDIDVSQIATKYGGGGHKKAAGFICDELPFSLI